MTYGHRRGTTLILLVGTPGIEPGTYSFLIKMLAVHAKSKLGTFALTIALPVELRPHMVRQVGLEPTMFLM